MTVNPKQSNRTSDARHFFISNSAHPCTEIALDANRVRQFYFQNGWEETFDPETAEDIIISTCAYNQKFEDASVEDLLLRNSQKKDGARVITTGCLSRINPKRFAQAGGDLAVAPLEMQKFDELIDAQQSIVQILNHSVRLSEYASNPLFLKVVKFKVILERLSFCFRRRLVPNWMATIPTPEWFFIRGSTGCMGKCTYCAVRKAKGSLVSTSLENILRQVRFAVGKGVREISMAGDDMGAWGIDLGWDLAELLTSIVLIPGRFKVNLRFVEPLFFLLCFERLAPVFSTGKISSFCLPLQSGSNRILARMGRGYTNEQVEGALKRFSQIPRRPRLASILMVGFPGETWEDFLATCGLMDRLPIDLYQILEFEARPNTPAISMPDQVPAEEKRRRHDLLLKKFKLQKVVGLPPWLVNRRLGLSYPTG